MNISTLKCVLLAGGRGRRIESLNAEVPKPMIPLGGMPILEHEINCLKRQGIFNVIITVSHKASTIMDYFGNGSRFGVHIEYFFEENPLGNAGALFMMKDRLTEDFLVINGDIIFDVDISRLVEKHIKKGALATILTHPNNHPYDSGLIVADKDDCVVDWLTKEDPRNGFYKNRVNAGIHILSPKVLDMHIEEKKIDLDRHILKPMVKTRNVFIYDSPEYVKDMGTPERYEAICNDYINGRIQRKNLSKPQRAVFFDRDGVINKYVGFLSDINRFELLDGIDSVIRRVNQIGYLAIVVTNQPVIARGEVTVEELENIHNKMETLLGEKGVFLDAVFYCPHHPERGFPGELLEYKIDCPCRKPKPGMLMEAARKYNINLKESWMLGDSENDILAGKAAGCHTVLLSEEQEDYGQNYTISNITDFIQFLQ